MLKLFDGPALGNVLRAVPVESGQMYSNGSFGASAFRDRELELPVAGFVPRDDLYVAENFKACLVGVVHEEKGSFIAGAEVSGGNVLAVAGDVGVGEGVIVEDAEEAGGASSKLDIGPAGLAYGGDIEAVAGGDEGFFIVGEGVVSGAALGQLFIGGAAPHFALDSPDVVGKGEGGELMGHWIGLLPEAVGSRSEDEIKGGRGEIQDCCELEKQICRFAQDEDFVDG